MFSTPKTLIRVFSIVLGVLLLALVFFPEMQRRPVHFLAQPFVVLITEIQKGILLAGRGIGGVWGGYVDLRNVREENQRLRDESSRLLAENIRLEEAALAHKRLEEILGLKQTGRFSFIPANVIGRDPTNWYQTLQLDKGTRDGVAVDMGVTTPRGVVGRVIEAGPTSSKILLLTDRNSAVAGLVQETRDEGIVEGTEKGLARIKYLSLLATSEEGHRVITSGLAGSFPKGFLIGILGPLTKKENDLFQEARVIPATDFSRLEEVLVITGLREEASKP